MWTGSGRRAAAALVLALALAACGREEQTATAPEVSDEERERLEGIGYVDFAKTPSSEGDGVVRFDPARSSPGYNLYEYPALQRAELSDARGRVVHAWRFDFPVTAVLLLENGDLLALIASKGGNQLARLDWRGRLVWRKPWDVHHDVALAPNGRFMGLIRRWQPLAELRDLAPAELPVPEANVQVREDGILLLDGQGERVGERWFYSAMHARPDLFRFQDPGGKVRDGRLSLDVFHGNSLEWMRRPELVGRHPLYDLGNVIVTMRNQNVVAIFRWEPWELVWAWGPGELLRPHNATCLDNGNLLIFDNRRGERWSRIVELDPVRREVVWEYRAPRPSDFYSGTRGSAQRLPNGNTLVGQSDEGRAFEVTPEGEIVWQLLMPERDAEGRRATFRRMVRHDSAAMDALLARFGETPAAPAR